LGSEAPKGLNPEAAGDLATVGFGHDLEGVAEGQRDPDIRPAGPPGLNTEGQVDWSDRPKQVVRRRSVRYAGKEDSPFGRAVEDVSKPGRQARDHVFEGLQIVVTEAQRTEPALASRALGLDFDLE